VTDYATLLTAEKIRPPCELRKKIVLRDSYPFELQLCPEGQGSTVFAAPTPASPTPGNKLNLKSVFGTGFGVGAKAFYWNLNWPEHIITAAGAD